MKEVKIGLTTHAKEALSERLRIREEKMPKVAMKAWRSTHIPTDNELPSKRHYDEVRDPTFGPVQYRKLMGHIFVFAPAKNGRREMNLVTVTPPTTRIAHASSRRGAYRHHQRHNLKNYVI